MGYLGGWALISHHSKTCFRQYSWVCLSRESGQHDGGDGYRRGSVSCIRNLRVASQMVAQLHNGGDFLWCELICVSWPLPPDTLDVTNDSQNMFQRSVDIQHDANNLNPKLRWRVGFKAPKEPNALERLLYDQILGQLDGEFLRFGVQFIEPVFHGVSSVSLPLLMNNLLHRWNLSKKDS